MSDYLNRIYATQVSSTGKAHNLKQHDLWKKLATTTSEYGAFYNKDSPRNPFQPLSLPPIDTSPRHSLIGSKPEVPAPSTYRSDHGNDGSYRLRLPEVKDVEVQFGTADYASASIFPSQTGNGRYEYTTFPSGMNTLKLHDVTEVTVKISMRDGQVFNFPCEPKVKRKKMDIWEVGLYEGPSDGYN